MRTFEATGCESFLLTDYAYRIEEHIYENQVTNLSIKFNLS